MRLPLEPEFTEERRRFDLRFCCEDCAHLDPMTDSCAHGWPTEEHRLAHYERAEARLLVFCKEFELG